MTRNFLSFSLLLLLSFTTSLDVEGYPTSDTSEDPSEDPSEDTLEDNDGPELALQSSWSLGDFQEDRQIDAMDTQREEALEKLQEIFGIRSQSDKSIHQHKVPPQFMVELYNTIADPSGVARGRNPYDAKVVRSFIEKDSSLSHFYFFNVSGLEMNESVLEAELHLYRKRTPLKLTHPSVLTSSYYLIRVYQVLDERSLDTPDLHRLLNVRYVRAHASGWQVFSVKRAVLAWLNGEPNLGLLVIASTVFEDEVTIEFSRRNDYHHGKQPILVLFDDDGSKEDRSEAKIVRRYYVYDSQDEEEKEEKSRRYGEANEDKVELKNEYDYDTDRSTRQRHKRQRGQLEESRIEDRHEPELFKRQKRKHEARRRREAPAIPGSSRKQSRRIVSEKTKILQVLTSMDIYERARLREKLTGPIPRERRSARSYAAIQENTTECSRHELYVDFQEIGLSASIISPKGYSAYQCKGICESPLSQDHQPTNHATVQSIVHKMGLVKGVERPCCVPTKLLSTSILFFDDNENVVLKLYKDMVADRCGCR